MEKSVIVPQIVPKIVTYQVQQKLLKGSVMKKNILECL